MLAGCCLTAFGQTETDIIKQANKLMAAKKYESAFILLNNFDQENGKPDVVLLKEYIVLNYFVTSITHHIFCLKDLEKNENIMDYRGKEGQFSIYPFQVDSILDKLITLYPTNWKLYKGLGEFYYEVYLKYGGRWFKSDEELCQLMQANSQKAVDGKCADYMSYDILGYTYLIQGKTKESIPYLLKSVKLNKDYASAQYNLAYAYLDSNNAQNALQYAKKSLSLYTDQVYKSDAAHMVGEIYMELKDDKKALKYYELANKISPGNYHTLEALLYLYVKIDDKKTEKTTSDFFNLEPTNPTIYNDLAGIYFSNDKVNALTDFYRTQFAAFKNDETVQGNLNFYLGEIFIGSDKKVAKDYFLKAQEIFNKIFDKNHQVFEVIEDGLKECE